MSWRKLYDHVMLFWAWHLCHLQSGDSFVFKDQKVVDKIMSGCHPSLRTANMMMCSIHIPILMMLLTLHQPTPKSHWPEMVSHYLELVELFFFQVDLLRDECIVVIIFIMLQ